MWSNVMVMSITCSPWLHVTSYDNPRTPCRIQKAQPETRKKTPTPPLTSHPTHHHTRRCIACGCILSPPAIGNNGLVASLISRIFLIRLLFPRQSTAHKFHSSDKTHLTGNCSLSCSLHNIPTTFSRPFALSSKCSVISCLPISLLHPYMRCEQPSKLQIQESRGPLGSYVGSGVDTSEGATTGLVCECEDWGRDWAFVGRWRRGKGGTAVPGGGSSESDSAVVGGESGVIDTLAARFRLVLSSSGSVSSSLRFSLVGEEVCVGVSASMSSLSSSEESEFGMGALPLPALDLPRLVPTPLLLPENLLLLGRRTERRPFFRLPGGRRTGVLSSSSSSSSDVSDDSASSSLSVPWSFLGWSSTPSARLCSAADRLCPAASSWYIGSLAKNWVFFRRGWSIM